MKNEDNVYYCSNCLSLAIKEDDGIMYCAKCNCAVIHENTIEQWEKDMKEKYPKKYILKSRGIFDYNSFKKENDYYK